MPGSIEGRDKKDGVANANRQDRTEKPTELDKGEYKGRETESIDTANRLQETGSRDDCNTERIIETIDNTKKLSDFMDRIIFISKNYTDISFIKKASAATLLTFILASIVCLGVALAITLIFYFVPIIANCVILVVLLISYLYKQNTNNQQATLLIITDFATSLLQGNSISDENQQHIIERLDQLATSKEFYEQVKISRKYFEDIFFAGNLETVQPSQQLAVVLNSMFVFIEKDLSKDQKKVFRDIKKQYLEKLTNDEQIIKQLLDNVIKSDSFKNKQNQQPRDLSALNEKMSNESTGRKDLIIERLIFGVKNYIYFTDQKASTNDNVNQNTLEESGSSADE